MSSTTKITLLVIVALGGLLAAYYMMNSDGKTPARAGAAEPSRETLSPKPAATTPPRSGSTRSPEPSLSRTPGDRDSTLPRRSFDSPTSAPASGTGANPAVITTPPPAGSSAMTPGRPASGPMTGTPEPEKDGAPPGFKPEIAKLPAKPSEPPPTASPTGGTSPRDPRLDPDRRGSISPAGGPSSTTPLPPAVTPTVTTPPKPAPGPVGPVARPVQYTIAEGDSMWTIAQKWFGDGAKWDLIAKANPLVDPTRLTVGQVLNMPPKEASRAEPASPAPRQPGAATGATTHSVASGDTLRRIAKLHYGDANRWQVIYDANRSVIGDDPHELQVGMKLTIPAGT